MPPRPTPLVWQDFLRFMDWTARGVLGKQPECDVYLNWVLFSLRMSYGDLGEG